VSQAIVAVDTANLKILPHPHGFNRWRAEVAPNYPWALSFSRPTLTKSTSVHFHGHSGANVGVKNALAIRHHICIVVQYKILCGEGNVAE
jgi:hypothetical protein